MNSLDARVWLGLLWLTVAMAVLIFVPAGTIRYWQAWTFLGIYVGASILVVLYLIKTDRPLLQRRMRGGPTAEKRTPEKVIMSFTSAGFIALLVVPGLDHRMGWSHVPIPVVIAGDAFIAVGWLIILAVFRENSFSSSTIEVSSDQRVVSTGPYAMVRHPMYAGALLMLGGIPPALGSYWGLTALAATAPFLLWRIFDEERFLSGNLPGYAGYCTRVRWRIIPGVF
jgi:protein-S-isoprenylcysteine O-methyltransferase Ste14